MAPAAAEQHPFGESTEPLPRLALRGISLSFSAYGHFGIPSTLRDAEEEEDGKPFPRGTPYSPITSRSAISQPSPLSGATRAYPITLDSDSDRDGDAESEPEMPESSFTTFSHHASAYDDPQGDQYLLVDSDEEEERDKENHQEEDGEKENHKPDGADEVEFVRTRHLFDLDPPPASPPPGPIGRQAPDIQMVGVAHLHQTTAQSIIDSEPDSAVARDGSAEITIPMSISLLSSFSGSPRQQPTVMEDEPVVPLRQQFVPRACTSVHDDGRDMDNTPPTPRPTRYHVQPHEEMVSLVTGITADMLDDDSFLEESIGDYQDYEEDTGAFRVTDHEPAHDVYISTPSPASDYSYALPPLPMDLDVESEGPFESHYASTNASDSDDVSSADTDEHMSPDHDGSSGAVLREPQPVRLRSGRPAFMSDQEGTENDKYDDYSSTSSDHDQMDEAGTRVAEDDSPDAANTAHDATRPEPVLSTDIISMLATQWVGSAMQEPNRDRDNTDHAAPVPSLSNPISSDSDTDRGSSTPRSSLSHSRSPSAGPEVHPIQRASRSSNSSLMSMGDLDSPAPSMPQVLPCVTTAAQDAIHIRIRESLSPEAIDRSHQLPHEAGAVTPTSSSLGQSTSQVIDHFDDLSEVVTGSDGGSTQESSPVNPGLTASDAGQPPSPSTQSITSSSAPVTPPQMVLEVESPMIASSHSTPAKRPLEDVDNVKPAAQRRRLFNGGSMGMFALGAAVGAVGTVAGLMQLAPQ